MLDFKNNKLSAVNWFKARSVDAVSFLEEDFRGIVDDLYVMAAPCSSVQKVNVSCESIASYLDQNFSWLHYVPQSLVRIKDAPKAATASKENRPRPMYQDHIRTIRYRGPVLNPFYGIIVIDDVLTTSSTFNACYAILRQTTPCEHIFGLFMGKTQFG
jgi:predicted amidophosphoribosyltransferase